MHEDPGAPGIPHHRRHARIPESTGDVVDHRRARRQRTLGDGRAVRVDADGYALGYEGLDDREDSPILFLDGDSLGAGASRLTTDVYEIGTLVREASALCDRVLEVEEAAAVGERIGRDVEDADDDETVGP
jgi:hypothetical protein